MRRYAVAAFSFLCRVFCFFSWYIIICRGERKNNRRLSLDKAIKQCYNMPTTKNSMMLSDKTDSGEDSGESRQTGAEGARRKLNLSGKRTEYFYLSSYRTVYLFGVAFSRQLFCFSNILKNILRRKKVIFWTHY